MAFDFISNFSTFQVLAPHKAPPGGSKPSSMSLVGLRFIHITALSDGNPNHTPTGRDYKKVDPPTLYLERCGDIWAKTYGLDKRYSHYLQTLPRGYTFWQKPRLGNPKHIDGWLYGHPRRKRFTSPNEFFTHLQYLVENQGISMGCPCRQCNGPTGTLGPLRPGPRSVSSTASISTPSVQQVTVSPAATPALESTTSSPAPTLARKPGRPPKDASATANTYKSSTNTPGLFKDEEGTPDVIQGLLKKLEKEGQLDQAIEEKLSPDFEAIRLPLKEWQEQTAAQPGWAPRAGEVVLFVRTMAPDCAISYEKHTRSFKIYDHTEKKFLGSVTAKRPGYR